jgi:hypothetical protein
VAPDGRSRGHFTGPRPVLLGTGTRSSPGDERDSTILDGRLGVAGRMETLSESASDPSVDGLEKSPVSVRPLALRTDNISRTCSIPVNVEG